MVMSSSMTLRLPPPARVWRQDTGTPSRHWRLGFVGPPALEVFLAEVRAGGASEAQEAHAISVTRALEWAESAAVPKSRTAPR